jgi:hypothetical protein
MEKLLEAIRRKNCILFVGAGVSMNLGLPSWGKLIDQMGKELDFDPEVFQSHGDYLTLAEYYRLKKGSIGPLRSWMDRVLHDPSTPIGSSKIHASIVQIGFPLIYTTNYDRWIELAFDHYNVAFDKVAKVSDLASIHSGRPQVIKFHGDFDDDASIVLDESSYFQRLDFESPLDIKLRADVLGKSVLFIGYSLSDINIRLLFWKLSQLWGMDKLAEAQPPSFVFTHSPNPIQEVVLAKRGIHVLSGSKASPGPALESFLSDLVEQTAFEQSGLKL